MFENVDVRNVNWSNKEEFKALADSIGGLVWSYEEQEKGYYTKLPPHEKMMLITKFMASVTFKAMETTNYQESLKEAYDNCDWIRDMFIDLEHHFFRLDLYDEEDAELSFDDDTLF